MLSRVSTRSIGPLLLLTPLLLLAGCFPAVYVSRPAVAGRVVDSAGQPVSHARLLLRAMHNRSVLADSVSNPDGTFCLPSAGHRWIIYFLPQDNPPPPAFSLQASAGALSSPPTTFTGGQIKPLGLASDPKVKVGDLKVAGSVPPP